MSVTYSADSTRSIGESLRYHLRSGSRAWEYITHILFVLPGLTVFGLLALFPIAVGLWYSLTDWEGAGSNVQFIGLSNYVNLLDDRLFWDSLKVTFKFVGLVVPALLVLALITAVTVNRQSWFSGPTKTAILVPLAMSPVAVGILFNLLTSPSIGLLPLLTGNPRLLENPNTALISVVIAQVWATLGMITFIFLAGLQAIPQEIYEAAEIDGAGTVSRFRLITIPLLWETVIVNFVLVLAMAFRSFSMILVLTGGGPYRATEVLALRMYKEAFGAFNLGYGAAIAMVLFVIIGLFVSLQLILTRSGTRQHF